MQVQQGPGPRQVHEIINWRKNRLKKWTQQFVFLICSGECCSPPNDRGDLEFINLRRGKHNDSTEPAMAAPKLAITPAPSCCCCCCSLNTPSFVSQNEAPWETTWECRDTKHWPISGCITMSLPWRAEPIDLLKKKNNNNRDQKTKNSARKQASSLVANNYKARDELRGTIDDDDDDDKTMSELEWVLVCAC